MCVYVCMCVCCNVVTFQGPLSCFSNFNPSLRVCKYLRAGVCVCVYVCVCASVVTFQGAPLLLPKLQPLPKSLHVFACWCVCMCVYVCMCVCCDISGAPILPPKLQPLPKSLQVIVRACVCVCMCVCASVVTLLHFRGPSLASQISIPP